MAGKNPQTPDDRDQASAPGMLGDETEEQDLDQPGNPKARITEKDVDDAFADARPTTGDKSKKD